MKKLIITLSLMILSTNLFAAPKNFTCTNAYSDEFTVNLFESTSEIEIIGEDLHLKSIYDITRKDDVGGTVNTIYIPRDRTNCPMTQFVQMTKIKPSFLFPCESDGQLSYIAICYENKE